MENGCLTLKNLKQIAQVNSISLLLKLQCIDLCTIIAATTSNITNLPDSGIFVTAMAVTIGSSGFLLLLILITVFMAVFAKRKGYT
jgi:uncharacterized membrane protein